MAASSFLSYIPMRIVPVLGAFDSHKSNTEPLVRLNVEARGDNALLKDKTNELTLLIRQL